MEERLSIIERALQIAKTGTVETVAQLHAQLETEGYTNIGPLLSGRSISSQLTRRITEARQTK